MIIKEEFYNIKCDCCGKTINDKWLPDELSARGEMAEDGSAIRIGGKDYCYDCYDYDDDLNLVTKDGRKFDGDTEEEITGNEAR